MNIGFLFIVNLSDIDIFINNSLPLFINNGYTKNIYVSLNKKKFNITLEILKKSKYINNINILKPKKVSWGGYNYTVSKIKSIFEILKNNNLDYIVILTGSCFPLHSYSYCVDILSKINKSMFINFNDEYNKISHRNHIIKNNPLIDNEFKNEYIKSLNHRWNFFIHNRYKEEGFFHNYFYKFIKFIIDKQWIKIDLFKESSVNFKHKIYSEWYFSTQNYFKISDILKIKKCLKKEKRKYKKIYAPDEKFWITKFKENNIDAIYNFKPTAYHCGEYFKIENNFQKNHFFNWNDNKPFNNIHDNCLFARNLKYKDLNKILTDVNNNIKDEK